MSKPTRTQSRGISLVEILIVLGFLGVLFSLASPSLSNATAKAELQAAVENMEYSIRMARTTARQLESGVIVHLNTDPGEKQHSVTFSFPARNVKPGSTALLQDFQFPPGIRLVSDVPSVQFDQRGMTDLPTQVMLVSRQDDDINQSLVIE